MTPDTGSPRSFSRALRSATVLPAYGFDASVRAAARRAWRAAEVVACKATPRRAALVRNALSLRLLQRRAPVAAKNITRMLAQTRWLCSDAALLQ